VAEARRRRRGVRGRGSAWRRGAFDGIFAGVAVGRRLLCIYQHAPTPGAPGIYRHRLYLSELARRGWDVDVIATPINYMRGTVPERYAGRPYVREVIDGIVHHWVWASSGVHRSRGRRAMNYATFATAAALRGATLARPDVIWASSPPLPVANLGELLAARYRRPWILEVRDLWPESAASVGWLGEETRLYRALERMAHHSARAAASVLVPTPGLAEPMRRHGARVVHVVPGSVFDSRRPPDVRARVRAELGVSDDTCLFVYVGALGVANGLQTLLDAAVAVAGDDRMSFVLMGDGSDRRRLEEEVRRREIPGVRFLAPVPKEHVPEILAAGDVCLHLLRPDPLFAGALPSKVLEYLGAHRPFITTVEGVPGRLAIESGGGCARSLDELVAELRRWAAMSPDERGRRGEQAFAYGRESFSVEANVAKLEGALGEAMRASA
jgi:putative colanic acid biosynthesis glycosyltransferase WcaI